MARHGKTWNEVLAARETRATAAGAWEVAAAEETLVNVLHKAELAVNEAELEVCNLGPVIRDHEAKIESLKEVHSGDDTPSDLNADPNAPLLDVNYFGDSDVAAELAAREEAEEDAEEEVEAEEDEADAEAEVVAPEDAEADARESARDNV